eukprot:4553574-Alexandrium_andersonii.AAC.1
MLLLPRRHPSKGSWRDAAAESPISAKSELRRAGRELPRRAMPNSSAAQARMVADHRGCAPGRRRSTCTSSHAARRTAAPSASGAPSSLIHSLATARVSSGGGPSNGG